MYLVRQVVALTGLPASTIRAWERRYQIVSPRRDDSQYRLYDDADVDRLRAMAALVDAGMSPQAAAERLRSGTLVQVLSPTPDDSPLSPDADQDDPDDAAGHQLLTQCALNLDAVGLARLLDQRVRIESFVPDADQWLLPSLTRLDAALNQGRAQLGQVEFAEQVVVQHLSHLLLTTLVQGHGPGSSETTGRTSAPTVLVGQVSPHRMISALVFTIACRLAGLDTRFVGMIGNAKSWVELVATFRPRAIVMVLDDPHSAEVARTTFAHITSRRPVVQSWWGGPPTTNHAPWSEELVDSGATRLPDRLGASVSVFVGRVLSGS